MTNDEAIIVLKNIAWFGKIYDQEQTEEAVEMAINALTAQPETHEERTETHACDCIERQAALDWLKNEWNGMVTSLFDGIEALPSAQPIIRCKECKHWLDIDDGRQKHRMCADIYGDWFCADAERKTNGN